jgi:hypothetical protein
MACQLPTECLNEIFENLVEEDNLTLYSCLLVNRFWCKIAVRILWRNILNFKGSHRRRSLTLRRSLRVVTSILSTLIACLPNESKELLYKNKIFISTPTSNPPLFNYSEFCKVLSINEITEIVNDVLENYNDLVVNEIIKMFTNQISSLKKFTYFYNPKYNISFSYVPGAKDLSELCCSSNLSSNFFCQLSQICHNLQSISISFENDVSNELSELKELISSQNNLKNLTLSASDGNSWTNIIPAIIKHSHTITKLRLYGFNSNLPFSFISSLTNLQELIISFIYGVIIKDFEKLLHVNFSKLEILKIPYQYPKTEYIMKFLENNGNNLKNFYLGQSNKVLNLSIANTCPKIKRLFVTFNGNETDILKNVLISCKYLESIKVWCRNYYLSEKDLLDTIVNYSSNNFHKLEIQISKFDISPKDLESFFVSWSNRTPKKLFSLIFIDTSTEKENLELIEKYENLGIIKFYTKQLSEYYKEEEIYFYY